jgi:hypothetical protein
MKEGTLSRLLFVAFLLLFAGAHGRELGSLQHLIDEGVNVVAARRVQHGEAPFRDFFYQQPPLQLYVLSLLPTDHFWYGRMLSLAWLAVSGGLLFLIARRHLPGSPPAAALAAGLFYFAGIQYWGLLALPNAAMLAFSLLGVYFVFSAERARPRLGAVCLAVSILFKPLTIVVFLAAAGALLATPSRRRELSAFVGTFAACVLLSLAALQLATAGAFADLLRQQGWRYAHRSGLDLLREGIPAVRPALEGLTPALFNLLVLRSAFAGADMLLIPAGLAGLFVLWRSSPDVGRGEKVLWSAWLALALVFDLFVWDITWEHYHLLELPPLCLLAGRAVHRVAAGRRFRTAVVAVVFAGYAVSGLAATRSRQRDYSAVLALRGRHVPLLAFDPTVNVLSRTDLACGIQDFFAQRLPGFLGPAFARFYVPTPEIVRCLEAAPEVQIVVHQLSDTGLFFIDEKLFEYIGRQPEGRVIYLDERARGAFHALY